MNRFIFTGVVVIVSMLLILYGCKKSFVDYGSSETKYNPNAPVDTIHFSTRIIPLFNNNCVSCHSAGTQAPNLEPAAAYNSVISGGYVNTASPSSSSLYKEITEVPNTHGGGEFQPQGDTLLIWIQQGALNN